MPIPPPAKCIERTGDSLNRGQQLNTNLFFSQTVRALPGYLSALQSHDRICTAPFEWGQSAVVPSEGVEIWVCLFLHGRSWGCRGTDRPYRNKHSVTQICPPTTALWPYSNGAVQIRSWVWSALNIIIPAKSRDIPPKEFLFALGFEGHTELFGPHPFTRKTPTPPEDIRTQKFGFVLLFFAWSKVPCSAQICQIKFVRVQTWHWHWHLIQIRSFPE